jgi:hypothetical protein
VRHTSEKILVGVMSFFALTGLTAVALRDDDGATGRVRAASAPAPQPEMDRSTPPADAAAWFSSIRRHCNAVEVQSRLRATPPPATVEGDIHAAVCYSLAGRVDVARDLIRGLPGEAHLHAAAVVFAAGHPAADAGDEAAAGPLMELVVEFWPDHEMALYHAGAARFELGDDDVADDYLERFLAAYSVEDGWRTSATTMLEQIRSR